MQTRIHEQATNT